MSVRTADVVAQAEKARVFSLRDAFASGPQDGGPPPLSGMSMSQKPMSMGRPASAGLSLKFSTPSAAPKPPTNLPAEVLKTLPATNSIISKRPASAPAPTLAPPAGGGFTLSAAATPIMHRNAAPPPAPTTAHGPPPTSTGASTRKVYPATAESARADVMRLAALVDDLQKKLAAATTKATAAERNTANATQRATADRNALSSKINTLNRELAISKDMEEKARIELKAVSSAKLEVDAAQTTRIEKEVAALQQTKAALLETLAGMNREHETLKTQSAELIQHAEQRRSEARAKVDAAQELEASAEERIKNARALELVEKHRLEVLAQEVKEASEELQSLKDKLVESNAALESATSNGTTVKRITYHRIPEIATNTPSMTAEERNRTNEKCACCAYGVPVALTGEPVGMSLPESTEVGGCDPSPEHHDEIAQTQLACAVQKDLLENFQENLRVRHEGRKRDVAPMYPYHGKTGTSNMTPAKHCAPKN